MESATLFLGLKWLDIITLLAILVGPILAVLVTRYQDRKKELQARRVDIFRTLMKTRQLRLSPDHVAALNLIELEFYGRTKVIEPYRAYMQHLSSPLPTPTEQDRYFEARHDLFVDLIGALGKELGYAFDKHDLARFSYAPTGWERDETRQRQNAALLTDILEGKRALPVTPMTGNQGIYPPAPQIDGSGS
jgi:hypothetical protein